MDFVVNEATCAFCGRTRSLCACDDAVAANSTREYTTADLYRYVAADARDVLLPPTPTANRDSGAAACPQVVQELAHVMGLPRGSSVADVRLAVQNARNARRMLPPATLAANAMPDECREFKRELAARLAADSDQPEMLPPVINWAEAAAENSSDYYAEPDNDVLPLPRLHF